MFLETKKLPPLPLDVFQVLPSWPSNFLEFGLLSPCFSENSFFQRKRVWLAQFTAINARNTFFTLALAKTQEK